MVQIQRLLCPLDFSPASLRSLSYGIKLGKDYGARLHLLHVLTPAISGGPEEAEISMNTLREQAESELMGLKKIATRAGVEAEVEVRTGDVCAEIADAVKAGKADLVVMGKHGRQGLERWFMGSVTERLLRQLPVPVLLVDESRPKIPVPPKFLRITVATDFSEGAQDAVAYALSLAQETEAKVTMLHVIPTTRETGIPDKEAMTAVETEIARLMPQEARDSHRLVAKIESGEPHNEILRFIEQTRPDLLIINIHDKGMLERAMFGSTAEHVIRGAPCPVFAIPPVKHHQDYRRPA